MLACLIKVLAVAIASTCAAASDSLDGHDAPLSLPEISPFKKKYQQRFNGTASVLVVFFHPDLPRWAATQPVVKEIAAAFIDDAVDVVLANCKTYKTFTALHGLRALPAFHLYPENVRAPFPFKLEYKDNKTATDYVNDIQSVRMRSSDLYGDLSNAAMVAAAELHSFEQKLAETALLRAKIQNAELEKLQWERKLRLANRTFAAQLQAHADDMKACEEALEAQLPPSADANCTAEVPKKPTTLVKAQSMLKNVTMLLDELAPNATQAQVGDSASVQRAAVDAQGSGDSAVPITQNTTSPADNSTADKAAVPVPTADFSSAKALAAAAKAELQQRIKRIEFFEEFLDKQASLGSGEVLRALNVRAADLYNSVVEQFVDHKRRDTVLVEMSALYPIADALATAAADAATQSV